MDKKSQKIPESPAGPGLDIPRPDEKEKNITPAPEPNVYPAPGDTV